MDSQLAYLFLVVSFGVGRQVGIVVGGGVVGHAEGESVGHKNVGSADRVCG
jgi:hypothetical protein